MAPVRFELALQLLPPLRELLDLGLVRLRLALQIPDLVAERPDATLLVADVLVSICLIAFAKSLQTPLSLAWTSMTRLPGWKTQSYPQACRSPSAASESPLAAAHERQEADLLGRVVLKTPVNWVVTVERAGLWTPRIVMHWCSASIITATPRGPQAS